MLTSSAHTYHSNLVYAITTGCDAACGAAAHRSRAIIQWHVLTMAGLRIAPATLSAGQLLWLGGSHVCTLGG